MINRRAVVAGSLAVGVVGPSSGMPATVEEFVPSRALDRCLLRDLDGIARDLGRARHFLKYADTDDERERSGFIFDIRCQLNSVSGYADWMQFTADELRKENREKLGQQGLKPNRWSHRRSRAIVALRRGGFSMLEAVEVVRPDLEYEEQSALSEVLTEREKLGLLI